MILHQNFEIRKQRGDNLKEKDNQERTLFPAKQSFKNNQKLKHSISTKTEKTATIKVFL